MDTKFISIRENIMKYYCLHHSPAKDRKEYLELFFDKQKLNVEWIEDFLPDSEIVINYPKVRCIHAADHNNILNNAEISLCLKHILAIEKICDINDYGIIFEDDIKETEWNFNDYIPEMIKEFENINGDILWIGSDKHTDINSTDKIKIISDNTTRARFSHCYMIHSKIANKIIDFYKKITAPSDWQWNQTIKHFKLKSCWSFPSIYQRTANKEIPSLIR
jgi:GR25 family glycosyltransferase involved in LPS biosynthesis